MRIFEWNDDLSFGIEEIDSQHKWLIDKINDFYALYQTDKADLAVMTMLDSIVEYMSEHFACEEDFLLRYGYPGLDAHRRSHRELAAKAAILIERFRETGAIPVDELAGFLIEWIYGHIGRTDRAYVDYIRSRGNE